MTIKINEELVFNTQKAHTECDSLAYLLTYMLRNNFDINSEEYKIYESKYMEAFKNFTSCKQIIEQDLLSKIPNIKNWSLDYETGVVKIETI